MKLIKYKNKAKSYSLNKSFWKEVLLNQKISKINWAKDRMKSIVLSSGQIVYLNQESEYSFSVYVNNK